MIKPHNTNTEFELGGINHVALVCSDMARTRVAAPDRRARAPPDVTSMRVAAQAGRASTRIAVPRPGSLRSRSVASLQPRPGLLDHDGPLRDFRADVIRKLLRRPADRLEGEPFQALADLADLQYAVHRLVQFLHYFGRRPG